MCVVVVVGGGGGGGGLEGRSANACGGVRKGECNCVCVIFFPIPSGTYHWPTAVWVSCDTRAALPSTQCILLALGRQELPGTQPSTCVHSLSTAGGGGRRRRGREWRRNGE